MIATSTTSLLRDRELQQAGGSGESYEIKEWAEEAVQKPNNTFYNWLIFLSWGHISHSLGTMETQQQLMIIIIIDKFD